MEKYINEAKAFTAAYAENHAWIGEKNFQKILEAFRDERVSTQHFAPTTGYGYNDMGRDKLESLYAKVFHTEAALVRQNIVSGSHAISLALAGNLLPGDELLSLGMPYDTLQTVMGIHHPTPGSLTEYGIKCRILDIFFPHPDMDEILAAITPKTKIVALQRSRGYSLRPSLHTAEIARICKKVKESYPQIIFFLDNCYGEFVEAQEPTEFGVDLMAGSLIKNPGAGLAPSGGYIVGRADLIERVAYRLTVAGAGAELGASLGDQRLFYESLFLAPQIVQEAVLGGVFASYLFQKLGYEVTPQPEEDRADIIQALCLGTAEKLIAFCQGIQRYSPVDSFVTPEPWPMPGYDSNIIMAAGGFVSGSSIELSADAPLREPFAVYLQGGLSRWHSIYAIEQTVRDMHQKGLL